MKVAVIGLGDIAQKGYLPVYAEREDLDVFLVSENVAKAERLVRKYRFAGAVASIEELPGLGVEAAFVHSTTHAHARQVEALLDLEIHVYVDKPVSMKIEDVRRLTVRSEEKGCHLVTGFNRRFAKAHKALLAVEDPNMVVMQKNRTLYEEIARDFIFEDFVHVADTLRFLTGRGEIEDLFVRGREVDGLLRHIIIQFRSGGIQAIGIMNRDNGVTEEVVEVMGPNEKRIAEHVTTVTRLTKEGTLKLPLDNWEPTLVRRGFVEMIDAFLKTVRGEPSDSVTARDSLATHELCADVLARLKTYP
ncbi:Gfo/Idh/MocA family protein [Exiguobacterium flavidum]|uniref:Gfo/Idh/MocA family protein n=1 Tax=Exiguobacterium flavidum TaxID=2184695 RepID=UPI000DF7C342|nr:Gfo/Idh/MocA family oxidoreductase [Exiguobacterium flavidum]